MYRVITQAEPTRPRSFPSRQPSVSRPARESKPSGLFGESDGKRSSRTARAVGARTGPIRVERRASTGGRVGAGHEDEPERVRWQMERSEVRWTERNGRSGAVGKQPARWGAARSRVTRRGKESGLRDQEAGPDGLAAPQEGEGSDWRGAETPAPPHFGWRGRREGQS